MNRLNFDNLKNIDVPSEWIENAVKIPHTYQKNRTSSFLKLSRIITTAACFVCISAVSFLLFSMNGFPNTPVAVQEPTTSAAKSSDEESTVDSYNPNGEKTSGHIDLNGTEGTTLSNSGWDGKGNFVTANPSSQLIRDNFTDSEKKNLKDNSNFSIPQNTTGKQNNNIKVPTQITQPQTKPEEIQTKPTETQTNQPPNPSKTTEPTIPTNTLQSVPDTTASSPSNPDDWQTVLDDVACRAVFSSDLLTGSGRVYCRLYNYQGYMIGDKNLFSNQHIADKDFVVNGIVYAVYSPVDSGLSLSSGKYYFYFYNENGKDIYQGSIQVD